MLYSNKYLKDIDTIDFSEFGISKKRIEEFEEESFVYGCSSYDLYDLNYFIALQLYVCLKMYLEKAEKNIDLEYHKYIFKKKEYTQKTAINYMIKNLRYYLNNCYSLSDKRAKKSEKKLANVFKMWNIIRENMWW